MMKIALRSALLAGAVLAAGGAQAATTVTSVNGPDTPQSNVLFDFNSGAPAGLTGDFTITTGTAPQLFAAPLGDTTPYLVVPGEGSSGTATLNLGGSFDNISFYWGSIDTYNSVQFFTGLNGTGTGLDLIGGDDVPAAPADGSQGNALNNRRVFFDFGSDSAQSVVFTSTNIAFELDDIATSAVPEPTVWMTMLAGFALVGGAVRRRRETVVTA